MLIYRNTVVFVVKLIPCCNSLERLMDNCMTALQKNIILISVRLIMYRHWFQVRCPQFHWEVVLVQQSKVRLPRVFTLKVLLSILRSYH